MNDEQRALLTPEAVLRGWTEASRLDVERESERFEAIAESGPVTIEDLIAALFIAAREFEWESYNAQPFRRLIDRLMASGVATRIVAPSTRGGPR